MAQREKTLSSEQAIDKIWELAESLEFCMLVTWDGERQRARPLAARPDREQGRIYFLSGVGSTKDEQIEAFPKVTMTFSDIHAHDYVAITGTATVSNDRESIRRLWHPADEAWWDSPDDASIRLIAVTPEDAEIWKGPNRFVAAARMLAAAVTGARQDLGQNRKVDHL